VWVALAVGGIITQVGSTSCLPVVSTVTTPNWNSMEVYKNIYFDTGKCLASTPTFRF